MSRIQEAKRAGYRVVVGVVHREDAERVLRDIELRAAQTGRYVGEAYFRRTHSGNLKN